MTSLSKLTAMKYTIKTTHYLDDWIIHVLHFFGEGDSFLLFQSVLVYFLSSVGIKFPKTPQTD